jgi:hypothetical protein
MQMKAFHIFLNNLLVKFSQNIRNLVEFLFETKKIFNFHNFSI